MIRLFLLYVLLISNSALGQSAKEANFQVGQIVSESTQPIAFGFRLVRRSVVNPPGHWEAVGHFSFLYYEDRQLCKCSGIDVSISPTGHYAIFQDGPSGKLRLYNVVTAATTDVTDRYLGSPSKFTWDEEKGKVDVTFFQGLKNGYADAAPLSVQLQ